VWQVEELLGRDLGWAAGILGQEAKKNTHEAIMNLIKMLCDRPMVVPPGLERAGKQRGYRRVAQVRYVWA